MRAGPTRTHDVTWQFTRSGLPVEITAESDNWRRIRDWEGSEGWVYHSLLSGRRTAMVISKPKDELVPLFGAADDQGRGGRASAARRLGVGAQVHRQVVPHRRRGLRRLDRAGAALGRLSRTSGAVVGSALAQHRNLRRRDDQADRLADLVRLPPRRCGTSTTIGCAPGLACDSA